MRVALLEDDPAQAELMRVWLEGDGHECHGFALGKSLIRCLQRDTFDLIILDWMLPDIEGIQVVQWIRAHLDWPVPVLFVTARDAEADVVSALESGADDYMSKPVKRFEMIARIRAITRRALPSNEDGNLITLGAYQINNQIRSVQVNGQPVELTQKEFDLVWFLFRNVGRVLSRGHILEGVWGFSPSLNTRTVDTHISRIRTKLALKGDHGWQLRAVYQHGYRLERTDEVVSLSP